MKVTIDEIMQALKMDGANFHRNLIANHIEQHGIAPSDEQILLEARMGVLFDFLENVCAVSTDERVATIANRILDTAKTNGIAPPDGMCIVPKAEIERLTLANETLSALNVEYLERVKLLEVLQDNP